MISTNKQRTAKTNHASLSAIPAANPALNSLSSSRAQCSAELVHESVVIWKGWRYRELRGSTVLSRRNNRLQLSLGGERFRRGALAPAGPADNPLPRGSPEESSSALHRAPRGARWEKARGNGARRVVLSLPPPPPATSGKFACAIAYARM